MAGRCIYIRLIVSDLTIEIPIIRHFVFVLFVFVLFFPVVLPSLTTNRP